MKRASAPRSPAAMLDVVVVGGGPAGLVIAGLLARRGRSVAVVERSRYDRPRAGEAFGAEVRVLLEGIGAWEDVAAEPALRIPFRGVQSAWGTDEPTWRPSILHALGEGMHVDRARFDARLAAYAERSGARVVRGSSSTVTRDSDGFVVTTGAREILRARFLVDASGRGAPASSSAVPGRRWLALDRQAAVVAHAAPSDASVASPADLLVESSEDGWWYTAPQPRGSLVVVLVTDADLVPAGGRSSLAARLTAALAKTVHTRSRVGSALRDAAVARAGSGRLLPDRAPGFRAVGDAAIAWDPLTGSGVVRALRSAIDAAPEVDAALEGRAQPAPSGPDPFLEYVERRAWYYGLEARWPDAPFWARRRAIDVASAPIILAPTAVLRRGDAPPLRAAIDRAEALVTPHAIARVIVELEAPRPAHEAMKLMRDLAPFGDKRLLVGLQTLVQSGALVQVG